jgi:hypothetical protein
VSYGSAAGIRVAKLGPELYLSIQALRLFIDSSVTDNVYLCPRFGVVHKLDIKHELFIHTDFQT